ncbi:hypothetical protein ACFLUB_00290 [Chloroflexota bacterium]
MVRVSDISAQYYCEKKLELKEEIPMPPTRRMQEGESGHEAITTLAEPITKEEAIQDALRTREKPVCMYEFKIGLKYKDIPIIGLVDEAWFKDGAVELLIERKFNNILSVYSPYHVQAQLYCLGLSEMGFDASNTEYGIMVFKPQCYNCEKLVDLSCQIFKDSSSFSCDKGAAKTFVYPFNKERTLEDLDWALEYWKGERNAKPTANPQKVPSV